MQSGDWLVRSGVVVAALFLSCNPLNATIPVASDEVRATTRVLREVTDSCLGLRWRLVVDPAHPAWPGRMVLLDRMDIVERKVASADRVRVSEPTINVIRAGDRVVVIQDSGIVRARLQAIAIESAATGQTLRVRLIGNDSRWYTATPLVASSGPVISVVATGAGIGQWNSTSNNATSAVTVTTRDRSRR